MEIKVRDNESLEEALKRFRRGCSKANIFSELRKRAYYEKPSDIRRRERQSQIRRQKKKSRN